MAKLNSFKRGLQIQTLFILFSYAAFKESWACSSRTSTHDLGGKSTRVNMTWLRQPTEFSRDHVGVVFNPNVLLQEIGSWSNGFSSTLTALLERVSTKFSKLLIPLDEQIFLADPGLNTEGSQLTLTIPTTVANLNLLNSNNDSRVSNKSLELLVEFNELTVDKMVTMAVEVNKIFPGTVKQMIYCPSILAPEVLRILISKVKWEAVNILTDSFGFGVRLNMDACGNRTVLQEMLSLHMDIFKNKISISQHELLARKKMVVYISSTVTPQYSNLGVERAFPLLKVMFENCRKNIDDYLSSWNQSVEVAFSTKWSIAGKASLHELVQFARFWEKMNEWADKTGTTVIFFSAFDASGTFGDSSREMYGWWSLVKNNTASDSFGNLMFEDKKQAALRYAEREPQDDTYRSSYFPLLTISLVLSTFLLSMTLFISCYLRRKRQSKFLRIEDLDEFFKGGDSFPIGGSEKNLNGPYNAANLELPKKSFKFDEASSLGSGEFGKVFLGTIRKAEVVQNVAVKTTKDSSSRTALRGLLFEIKILAYLGKHPHVVELIGAYTSELRKGKFFLVLEFCQLGSMWSYLRRCKPVNEMDGDSDARDYDEEWSHREVQVAELDGSLESDLFRWSGEVASGMEYIASKHVVHLDIASRNVLLTAEKRAKITDFGLSRRMYDYQTYIKTHQEALPWRWLSPEALRRSEFTEKSDVWAFGVLIWEIFTLGDEPYPGLSYDVNFPTKLEKGLRPEEPKYNRNRIYSVMLRCWSVNPERRPTFSELVTTLVGQNKLEPISGPDCIAIDDSSAGPPTVSADDLNKAEENCSASPSMNRQRRATFAGNYRLYFQTIYKEARVFMWTRLGYVWSLLANILLLTMLFITLWVISPDMATKRVDRESKADIDAVVWLAPTEGIMPKETSSSQFSEKRIQLERSLGQKLLIEIERGNEGFVKELVLLGANLNERNDNGETALLKAAASNNKTYGLEIIKFLMENGVDMEITIEHKKSYTFLHRMVAESKEGTTFTAQQFEDIAKCLCSRNQSQLFNTPGDFSKEFQTPRHWYHWSTPFQLAVRYLEVTLSLLKK